MIFAPVALYPTGSDGAVSATGLRRTNGNQKTKSPREDRRLSFSLAIEKFWSGRRDSNPRPRPWQGRALPLSYTRIREISGDGAPATGRAMPNAAHECNSRSMVRRTVVWRLYPPESADSGVDRSDRSENAPKTGKIVKIARFGPTEGPTT